ncbi:MAG: outer membrane beta-barrel protein [Chitinophagaceae bacterium]
MTKVFLITALTAFSLGSATAQDSVRVTTTTTTTAKTKRDWSKIDLSSRANDHFMIQFGADGWSGAPDSIRTKGFSRHFNMYFMLDKPFKTDPRFSVGFGVGIGSSNIFLNNTLVDVAGKTSSSTLVFKNADSSNHYKKYKLATAYAEIPVELRYSSNPLDANQSWKLALGVKLGTLLDAHTKGKEPQDKNGNTLSGMAKVIEKEKSKKFFNSTRIAATARIGYGHFSLYGSYQLNSLIKDGFGPQIKPWSIGLCLTGL